MFIPRVHKNIYKRAKVEDLSGGINLSENALNIKDNQCTDIDNMWVQQKTLETRPAVSLDVGAGFGDIIFQNSSAIVFESIEYFCTIRQNKILFETAEGVPLVYADEIYPTYCMFSSYQSSHPITKAYLFRRSTNEWHGYATIENTKFILAIVLSSDLDFSFSGTLASSRAFPFITELYGVYSYRGKMIEYDEELEAPCYTPFGTKYTLAFEGEFSSIDEYVSKYFNDSVSPYIPTVRINMESNFETGTITNAGDMLEDFNVLTPQFKQEYNVRKTIISGGYYSENYLNVLRFPMLRQVDMFPQRGAIAFSATIYGVFKFSGSYDGIVSHEARWDCYSHPTYNFGNIIYKDDETGEPIEFEGTDAEHTFVSLTDSDSAFDIAFYKDSDATPATDILDYVYIEKVVVTATVPNYNVYDVEENTIALWYGGSRSGLSSGTRLLVSGNLSRVNELRWSDLNNQLYFPENNFAYVGVDSESIIALSRQDSFLVIFKEKEIYAAEYLYSTSDKGVTSVTFPITPISPNIGCDCPQSIQLINNNLVWLSSDAKVSILVSANQFSERSVSTISANIYNLLKEETKENLETACSADYNGNYFLFIRNIAYIWNYDAIPFANYSSSEKSQDRLAWFKWTMPLLLDAEQDGGQCLSGARVSNGKLQLVSDFYYHLIFSVDFGSEDIESSFTTKIFDFDLQSVYKRINRIFLDLKSEEDCNIIIEYTTDKGTTDHSTGISNTGLFNKGNEVLSVRPNIRKARTLSLTVKADKPLEINSISFDYETLGEVK